MRRSNLTDEQKLEIYELYKAGERPAVIQSRFGITRQTMHNAISKAILLNQGLGRRLPKSVEQSPYVNLREWLRDASHPNVSMFCREVFGNTNTVRFLRIMSGGEQAHLTVSNIRRMEKLTGMPFSQLFAHFDQEKEDDHDNSAI